MNVLNKQTLTAAALAGILGIGGAIFSGQARADEAAENSPAVVSDDDAATDASENSGAPKFRGHREKRRDHGERKFDGKSEDRSQFSAEHREKLRAFREELRKEFTARRDLIIDEQQTVAKQSLQTSGDTAAVIAQVKTQFQNALIKFPFMGKEIFKVWKDAIAESDSAAKTEFLAQVQGQYIEHLEKFVSRFHGKPAFNGRPGHDGKRGFSFDGKPDFSEKFAPHGKFLPSNQRGHQGKSAHR